MCLVYVNVFVCMYVVVGVTVCADVFMYVEAAFGVKCLQQPLST